MVTVTIGHVVMVTVSVTKGHVMILIMLLWRRKCWRAEIALSKSIFVS